VKYEDIFAMMRIAIPMDKLRMGRVITSIFSELSFVPDIEMRIDKRIITALKNIESDVSNAIERFVVA
jgi:hypothetical protein